MDVFDAGENCRVIAGDAAMARDRIAAECGLLAGVTQGTKERPVLFSGAMVRAILAGRKTQTRRLLTRATAECVSLPKHCWKHLDWDRTFENDGRNVKVGVKESISEWDPHLAPTIHRVWPRVVVGDVLWVRETWRETAGAQLADGTIPKDGNKDQVFYRATDGYAGGPWRPGIFMPRWASRLLLEVTGVRVERLQEITMGDALAEGLDCDVAQEVSGVPWHVLGEDPVRWFAALWDAINGKRADWASNPWVVVMEFVRVRRTAFGLERVEPRIDANERELEGVG